jgi:hypothetical protein
MGETWVYLTGQHYEIVDVRVDEVTQEEEVIYKEQGTRAPLWRMDMDDFMATMGDEGDTITCFFQKI